MRFRPALIALTVTAAALTLSACSLLANIPIPGIGHTPTPSPRASQPVDADGFTAAQETLIGEVLTESTGKSAEEAKAILGARYAAIGKSYVTAAEPLCKVSPKVRESSATHDGFVAGVKKASKLPDATIEQMWLSILEYCKTED